MRLINDKQITISTGNNRKALTWGKVEMTISELYDKLSHPQRGAETMQEYLHMKKSRQDELKDVGGFVGGTFEGPRRKADKVTGRSLITLDFDNVPGWGAETVHEKVDDLGCSFCIYSTRKHTPELPRLRIVIPLARTITADEYEPIARKITEKIGIGMADPTTFETARLMYWPSCCSDSEFYYQAGDKPLLIPETILDQYKDWRDINEWPQHPKATFNYQREKTKKGEPTEKEGVVGAFCRTYDIYTAMEKFLPGIYSPCDNAEDRYTYLNGSTTGGAVIYEDGKFLYSHHATDPCSMKLVNAYDLVRLHKFGDLDKDTDPGTPINRLPSDRAMSEYATKDSGVIATMNRERAENYRNEFIGIGAPMGSADEESSAEEDLEWQGKLEMTQNGQVKNTIANALRILENDPLLKDKFALNEFAGRGEVLQRPPWETPDKPFKRRLWNDTDNDGLYLYMEVKWGLTGRGNIDSALNVHTAMHAFNEVQGYLNGLKWDGIDRLDTLFIDYLSAEDTEYTRAVTRKSLVGAVARALNPGCKFDNMLILTGPQGAFKSSLLQRLSRGWFNDSIRTFEGKEASELLQGVWLVEIQELDAFRKSDVARIKQFLSLKVDRYRAAYGRHVKECPRNCVFFGTTNADEFLQDMTGNRRFWPVKVGPKEEHVKNVFTDLTDSEIDQIWAEAVMDYRIGEDLYLSGELEQEAMVMQEGYREASGREGMALDFINHKVPKDWSMWTLDRRRDFWAGGALVPEEDLVERDRICAVEIWCEAFGGKPGELGTGNRDTREINAIIAKSGNWKKTIKPLRFGPYGPQRGFTNGNEL